MTLLAILLMILHAVLVDEEAGGLTVRTSRLTCNRSVVSSNPNKGSHCFLEQETLPSLLSTGWFQERIRIRFHNRTKINLVLRQIDINLII